MKKAQASGASAPPLLIIILLISFLLSKATAGIVWAFHVSQHQKFSHSLKQQLLYELVEASSQNDFSEKLLTKNTRSIVGSLPLFLSREQEHLYQLDSLLSLPEGCPRDKVVFGYEPPLQLVSSASAFTSVQTCQYKNFSLSTDLRTRYNLESKTLTQQFNALAIVSNGYISISRRLSISDPVTVIAGGDVWIREVQALSPDASLTIISLGGGIIVEKTAGLSHIAADGIGDVILPHTLQHSLPLAFPPPSTGWIEGLYLGQTTGE